MKWVLMVCLCVGLVGCKSEPKEHKTKCCPDLKKCCEDQTAVKCSCPYCSCCKSNPLPCVCSEETCLEKGCKCGKWKK